eukprot:gene31865-64474_t
MPPAWAKAAAGDAECATEGTAPGAFSVFVFTQTTSVLARSVSERGYAATVR